MPGARSRAIAHYPKGPWAAAGGDGCCGFIFCSSGLTCRTLEEGGTMMGVPCRTKPRCANFCYLLEEHQLGGKPETGYCRKGAPITTGTIVDATIIHAPSSTKNRGRRAIRRRHQVLRMRSHVGVDSKTKIIHSAATEPTWPTRALPESPWRDARCGGWRRIAENEVIHEMPPRRDMHAPRDRYKNHVDEVERAKNRNEGGVRSSEHVFQI